MDDDAPPVWSEAAIARIEAVLLELEQATPALAEAPQEFRKYLVRATQPPRLVFEHQTFSSYRCG